MKQSIGIALLNGDIYNTACQQYKKIEIYE
jgi:hypothetical protein